MIELRTSERTLFGRCPQRWEWAYEEGLRPIRTETPLWFGSLVHECLAAWYLPGFKRGPHPAETFESLCDESRSMYVGSDEAEQDWVDAKELGIEMMTNYVNHYGKDEHKNYIATEQTGTSYLPALGKSRGRDIKYFFTVDGVFRDERDGFIKMDEHKTAKSTAIGHLPLDRQAGAYWALIEGKLRRMGVLKPGDHIDSIQYNFLKKSLRDKRPMDDQGMYRNKPIKKDFEDALLAAGITMGMIRGLKLTELAEMAKSERLRVLGEVSKIQPQPLFQRVDVFRTPEERKRQLRHIREDAWHIDQARNNPAYPIVKNVQSAGSMACPQCPYFRMCELDEQGDKESVEDFKVAMFVKADPYEGYRKSA